MWKTYKPSINTLITVIVIANFLLTNKQTSSICIEGRYRNKGSKIAPTRHVRRNSRFQTCTILLLGSITLPKIHSLPSLDQPGRHLCMAPCWKAICGGVADIEWSCSLQLVWDDFDTWSEFAHNRQSKLLGVPLGPTVASWRCFKIDSPILENRLLILL